MPAQTLISSILGGVVISALSTVAIGCSTARQSPAIILQDQSRILISAENGASEEEVIYRLEQLRDWFWSFISPEGEFYILPFMLDDRPAGTAITKDELLALPLTVEQQWSLLRFLQTDVVWENKVGQSAFYGEPTREDRIVWEQEGKERGRRADLLAELRAYYLPNLPDNPDPDSLKLYSAPLTRLLPAAFKAIEEGSVAEVASDPWDLHSNWAQRVRRIAFLNGAPPCDCPPGDIICEVACEEQEGDPSGVIGYVDYVWYRDDANHERVQVPADIVNVIIGQYALLRNELPPHLREYTSMWWPNVSYYGAIPSDQKINDQPTFWLRSIVGSSTDQGTIEISPVLVRAAFLQAIGSPSYGYTLFAPGAYERILSSGRRTVKDLDAVSTLLMNRFITAFRFALAHEMAHVYLGRGTGLYRNENRVDCYAVWHLQQAERWDYEAAGLFQNLMGEAVREGSANILWGDNIHWSAVEERLAKLDNLADRLLEIPPEEVCEVDSTGD